MVEIKELELTIDYLAIQTSGSIQLIEVVRMRTDILTGNFESENIVFRWNFVV